MSAFRFTRRICKQKRTNRQLEFNRHGDEAIMKCKIQKLVSHNEEVWIINLPTNVVPDFIVLFAALHLGTLETMHLVDKSSNCIISIQRYTKKNKAEYIIRLDKEEYPISKTSLEAIAALMTHIAINGWSNSSHIDIEITESISVCFAVELLDD